MALRFNVLQQNTMARYTKTSCIAYMNIYTSSKINPHDNLCCICNRLIVFDKRDKKIDNDRQYSMAKSTSTC